MTPLLRAIGHIDARNPRHDYPTFTSVPEPWSFYRITGTDPRHWEHPEEWSEEDVETPRMTRRGLSRAPGTQSRANSTHGR